TAPAVHRYPALPATAGHPPRTKRSPRLFLRNGPGYTPQRGQELPTRIQYLPRRRSRKTNRSTAQQTAFGLAAAGGAQPGPLAEAAGYPAGTLPDREHPGLPDDRAGK